MTELEQPKPELKISTFLEKGLVVMEKVTSKDVTLNKNEMIDLINFETAVKFIIEAEQKSELSNQKGE
jgi:hypothetical protein